jgi:hypothetical protein
MITSGMGPEKNCSLRRMAADYLQLASIGGSYNLVLVLLPKEPENPGAAYPHPTKKYKCMMHIRIVEFYENQGNY